MEEKTKALVLEFEKIDEKEGILKEVLFLDNPLGGGFKVSNGKITAYFYIHDKTVDVFLVDKEGNVRNKKISL